MQYHIPGSHYIQARSYYKVDYQINSSGFRGEEIAIPKQKKYRLAIIGDSIVEGHGCPYEKTFPALMNKKTEKTEWEVINLGVQGASPIYYAGNLKRYLSSGMDAVILVLFENDLYDDRAQEKNYFNLPILDHPSQLFIDKRSGLSELLTVSRLFTLLKRAYLTLRPSTVERIIDQNRFIDTLNNEQKALSKICPSLVAPSMLNRQWEMSRRYLNFFTDNLKDEKIPIVVVYLALGNLAPEHGVPYKTHVAGMEDAIQTWTQHRKLPFISLIPFIKDLFKNNPAPKIMIQDDGHPTPLTHQLIADQLWTQLVEKTTIQ